MYSSPCAVVGRMLKLAKESVKASPANGLVSNIIAIIVFFHPALSGGTSYCRSRGAIFLSGELHNPLPEDLCVIDSGECP